MSASKSRNQQVPKNQAQPKQEKSSEEGKYDLPLKTGPHVFLLIAMTATWTLAGLGVWVILFGSTLFSFVGLIAWNLVWTVIIFGLIFVGDIYLYAWAKNFYYILDQDEIILYKGVFFQKRKTVRFPTLDLIDLEQSFIGKILNYGSIRLVSTETGKELTLKALPNPYEYVELIRERMPGAERF